MKETERIYIDHFRENIESARYGIGISQQKMAALIGMPFTTYKNMLAGSMASLPIAYLIEAEKVTGLTIYQLIGEHSNSHDLNKAFLSLPDHRQTAIRTMILIEQQLSAAIPDINGSEETTCYTVTGNIEDGMLFDSVAYETVNISKYVGLYPVSIDCAIKINTNHLHPVYLTGDILLIHQGAPRDGDTGIFINKRTCRAYIRRFKQTQPCELLPINGIGKPIFVDGTSKDDMAQWIKFGYVITKMR